jgi:hypothetical protein
VNEVRATVAIVRRHMDRRFATDWAMQFVIVAAIAYVFTRTFAHPVLPLLIASTLSAATTVERTHAQSLRRLTFFAMPLYGRQLARAHAVAPAILALSIPAGYALGSVLRTHAFPATLFIAMTCAALIATLVALSSIFREGWRAWLYVGLAVVAGPIVTLPYVLHMPAHEAAAGLALTVAIGFFALRAFSETLARYDPIELRQERG